MIRMKVGFHNFKQIYLLTAQCWIQNWIITLYWSEYDQNKSWISQFQTDIFAQCWIQNWIITLCWLEWKLDFTILNGYICSLLSAGSKTGLSLFVDHNKSWISQFQTDYLLSAGAKTGLSLCWSEYDQNESWISQF